MAASEARYNPMAYHNGGVWPHDNALIAYGFSTYGMANEAARVLAGMFDAAMFFNLHRVPDLFCGFPRGEGEGPIPYPVACAPQSWSAASAFLLFQACTGLRISGTSRKISFVRPLLPEFLNDARILNLKIADAAVDVALIRHNQGVSANVLSRRGDVEIVVVV